VGFTEPHGGSDAAGIRSHAKEDGDDWILNGSKRMVDNTAHAKFIVVTARTDGEPRERKGISMFVIRPEDEGFNVDQVYRTLGIRAAGVGRFSFNECHLPADRLLGTRGQGFYQMMDMVEFGRIGVAAICIGMVEAALASTVGYLRERVVFGAPLSDNAALIATVADIRTRLDAARLLTEHGAALVDDGVRCQKESAEAKVFASDLAVEATSTLLRLHGGIAYTEETPLEMLVRDAHCFVIGEGTSDVLRMIIGKHEMGRP
jgi:alkylation response protein AidB-like acyl-CoA dehydrogenase